jgi:hypothetical protein
MKLSLVTLALALALTSNVYIAEAQISGMTSGEERGPGEERGLK